MAHSTSPEAREEAEQALRKLSRDLATYRDPAVRRHLQMLSPTSANASHLSDNPAHLKAVIIAMRTELHESEEAHNRAKSDYLDAKKRAVKAEAEVEELKAQMHEKDVEHEEIVKGAADRMQTLEKEHIHATQSAHDKALILHETIERDRLGNAGILAEKSNYQSQAKELQTEVSAMKRELRAVEARHRVEEKTSQSEIKAAESKIAALQDELKFLKQSLHTDGEVSKQLQASRRQSVDLQRDAARIQSELAEQTKQSITLRQRLAESQQVVLALKQQLSVSAKESSEAKALRREVEKLRIHKEESENIRLQSSALVSEKEELTRLIAGLSSSGDVQEGLKILRTSNLTGFRADTAATQSEHTPTQKHRQLEAAEERHRKESESWQLIKKQLEEKVNLHLKRLVEAIAERDQARSRNKRNERVRQILEHEKKFFKAALERIEADFDDVPDKDGQTASLQERCKAFEKSAKDYESAMKEVENSLVECQGKVRLLTLEIANLKDTQQSTPSGSGELDRLKAELSQAVQAAKDATEAKRVADEDTTEAKEQLASLRDELERIKLAVKSKEAKTPVAELDYDPSVTKVLHLKDNLLSQAIEAASAESEKAKGKKRMRIEVDNETSPPRNEVTDQRISELQTQIEALEHANAKLVQSSKVGVRTGEIAKKKIEEVRGAVYNLFGWSMKLIGAKYIISSIYAERPDDVLEFGVNEAGTMILLETGYTTRVSEEIEQFVHKMKSIPALLASITMENFEKSTLM